MAIWHIFPRFGILHREKSGNPDAQTKAEQPISVNIVSRILGFHIFGNESSFCSKYHMPSIYLTPAKNSHCHFGIFVSITDHILSEPY
jgi:hypothetical protein